LKVFWASDNPVVLHNSFPYGERGLSAPGIEIYLTISSNLIVGLLCPSSELKIKEILSVDLVGVDHNMYQDLANGLQQELQFRSAQVPLSFLTSFKSSLPLAFFIPPMTILHMPDTY
jgi:hypothetical protein